jgi:hypothetical protein
LAARARKRKRRAEGFQAPPKRGQATAERARASADAPRPEKARRSGKPERPPAPWGSFPLVELVVLLALVMLIAGFFVSGTRGVTLIATGLTLGMLAGLELAVREHFAGYKSHSTVLAGGPAVVVLGIGFWQGWPQPVNLLAGALVFAAGFYLFREAFKRRTGGIGFR